MEQLGSNRMENKYKLKSVHSYTVIWANTA